MKFNKEEVNILVKILKYNLQLNDLIESQKEITYQTLFEKFEKGEYIKGRLLNFLFTEVSTSDFKFNNFQDSDLLLILKKIKFKATPR